MSRTFCRLSLIEALTRSIHLFDCPRALDTSSGNDFTGSAGVFSIVFQCRYSKPQVQAFVEKSELFEIGYSWARVTSLAVAYDFRGTPARPDYGHRLLRLKMGLEGVADRKEDLDQALVSALASPTADESC